MQWPGCKGMESLHGAIDPGILPFKIVTFKQCLTAFAVSFVHGRNIYARQRMGVLQCMPVLCLFLHLLYYLTHLLPPYL